MADEETGDYHKAESGASDTFPIQAGALKKGDHCVIKERPCKIVEYSTSKTGKHGHAKAHIVGIDVFTGKKMEELCPTTHNMLAPVIKRDEYTLVDIGDDGYLTLLTGDSEEKGDVKLPDDEMGQRLKIAFDQGKEVIVTVMKAMGTEGVCAIKETQN